MKRIGKQSKRQRPPHQPKPDNPAKKAQTNPAMQLAKSAQAKLSFCGKLLGDNPEFIDFLGAMRGVAMTAAPSHKAYPKSWETYFKNFTEGYYDSIFRRINGAIGRARGKKPSQITEKELRALFLSMVKKHSSQGLTVTDIQDEHLEKARQGRWAKAYFG